MQIGGFCVLLWLTRLLALITNINDIHTIFPDELLQLRMAQDFFREHLTVGELLARLWDTGYLSPNFQFHGLILINNVWMFLLSLVLGFHYYNLHLAALCYMTVAYVFWARLIDDRFGRRAFFFFSTLFLFAPQEFISYNLYLMGSHPESLALFAIMYFLVFYGNRAPYRYLFFLSFGFFFFLYKGVLIALPLLLWPAVNALRNEKKKLLAVPLFALGFAPLLLFQLKNGFYSHFLQDGRINAKTSPHWFNAWNLDQLPSFHLYLPELKFRFWHILGISDFLYPVVFILCGLGLLLVVLRLADIKFRRRVFLENPQYLIFPAVLLYPVLLSLVLTVATFETPERYAAPVYPFVFVITAVGLNFLPRRAAWAVLVVLLLFLVPDTLSLIKPQNGALFLRYDGIKYLRHDVRYVPLEEMEFVDWWIDHCPDNRGLRKFYNLYQERTIVRQRPPDPLSYRPELMAFFNQRQTTASDVVGLGLALGIRWRQDRHKMQLFYQVMDLPDATRDLLAKGVQLSAGYRALPGCPG